MIAQHIPNVAQVDLNDLPITGPTHDARFTGEGTTSQTGPKLLLHHLQPKQEVPASTGRTVST